MTHRCGLRAGRYFLFQKHLVPAIDKIGRPRQGSEAAIAVERALNVLSLVFAHIYFPTVSNDGHVAPVGLCRLRIRVRLPEDVGINVPRWQDDNTITGTRAANSIAAERWHSSPWYPPDGSLSLELPCPSMAVTQSWARKQPY
jgi:hypothetical protein